MLETRKLLSDGIWVAGLQGIAAVGQIIGIRLLTEVLPPTVFGEFSLWFGVALLMSTAAANPVMQALLKFYPEYALHGKGILVRVAARRQLVKLATLLGVVYMVCALAILIVDARDLAILFIIPGLVTVEVLRINNMALLNAVRAHRAFGIWVVLESWGRPLLAWLLIVYVGAQTEYVLAGYILASFFSLLMMRHFVPREKMSVAATRDEDIERKIWRYLLPLLPLGILGWISSMADRYIIGTLLSAAEVGLYVAIYGLSSRPVLLLGNIVETTIRPVYQSALAKKDQASASAYLNKWVLVLLAGSCAAVILSWMGHDWIARYLLGEEYRGVSYLMPWIVAGYSLYVMSYIPNRVCYANSDTQKILYIEVISAISALVFGALFIQLAGIAGAAISIPFYFGLRLIASYVFARPWLRISNRA